MLDIDGALKFLALDNVLMNGDSYWEDASDFNIYLDPKARFHFVHDDVNEAFRPIRGRGGAAGRGVAFEPLANQRRPEQGASQQTPGRPGPAAALSGLRPRD